MHENRGKFSDAQKKAYVKKAFTGERGAIIAQARAAQVTVNTMHDWGNKFPEAKAEAMKKGADARAKAAAALAKTAKGLKKAA